MNISRSYSDLNDLNLEATEIDGDMKFFECLIVFVFDWLPWALLAASVQNIPAAEFITSSSTMTSFMFHYFKKSDVEFPFPEIYFRDYENKLMDKLLSCASNPKEQDCASEGFARFYNIVLIKGSRKIEGKYID
ncbi:Glycosyltransferase [Abeliophyllum distichum]|uniref:Glycosyltransferase n=1 Tax=Abeliophyllum distichum TaxID=126358 RepID=A0ABD1RRE5_9LAMI